MARVLFSLDRKTFFSKIKGPLKDAFSTCKSLAIKIHFGEPGNQFTFKPEDIKPITDTLKSLSVKHFFFDSSVAYPNSPRGVPASHLAYAKEKGWHHLAEVRTNDEVFTEVRGKHMTYEVCQELVDADGVLVVSHVKGHVCAGFGGAIKNLGMGALTKKSKGTIHHGGQPKIIGTCTRCGSCVESCPVDGIRLEDHPYFDTCFGCSNCTTACPQGILVPNIASFDALLADGAAAAISKFKKQYYISFLTNITKLCDCMVDPEGLVAKDAGYLASSDPVAIDQAAHDKIKEIAKDNVFLLHNKKSGLDQVKYAQSYGAGESAYVFE